MRIYIHTSGRPDRQVTWNYFPRPWRTVHVRFVVQHRERDAYRKYAPLLIVLPKDITTLSPTRQWIVENAETEKFVMMDDDLAFAARRKDKIELFLKNEPGDYIRMFQEMEKLLDTYAHVGVIAREGANRLGLNGERVEENIRMMRVLAYRKSILLKEKVRFDRVPTKQDFDMTLQLLRKGYPNAVMLGYSQGQQGGSNEAGGCSVYRTEKIMNESAVRLAKLHPGFVKVVTKTTKIAWGGGERVDVQIAWKKAYESSKA